MNRDETRDASGVPQPVDLSVVLQQASSITTGVAERASGGLGLTGPVWTPDVTKDWPSERRERAVASYAAARENLMTRVREIDPAGLVPDPVLHGLPVLATAPWVIVEWALEGKILAAMGLDLLGSAAAARLSKPWDRLFADQSTDLRAGS